MQVTKSVEESPKHNQTTSHMDLVASSLSGVLVSDDLFCRLCLFRVLGKEFESVLLQKESVYVLIMPFVLYCVEKTWLHATKEIV